MTDYELIDVQATYGDLVSMAFKYWTTTTFALVAAAYMAGPALGAPICIGIAIVYLSLATGNVFNIRKNIDVVTAASEDLKSLAESSTNPQATVEFLAAYQAKQVMPLLLAVQVGASICSVVYLFYRGGLLG